MYTCIVLSTKLITSFFCFRKPSKILKNTKTSNFFWLSTKKSQKKQSNFQANASLVSYKFQERLNRGMRQQCSKVEKNSSTIFTTKKIGLQQLHSNALQVMWKPQLTGSTYVKTGVCQLIFHQIYKELMHSHS